MHEVKSTEEYLKTAPVEYWNSHFTQFQKSGLLESFYFFIIFKIAEKDAKNKESWDAILNEMIKEEPSADFFEGYKSLIQNAFSGYGIQYEQLNSSLGLNLDPKGRKSIDDARNHLISTISNASSSSISPQLISDYQTYQLVITQDKVQSLAEKSPDVVDLMRSNPGMVDLMRSNPGMVDLIKNSILQVNNGALTIGSSRSIFNFFRSKKSEFVRELKSLDPQLVQLKTMGFRKAYVLNIDKLKDQPKLIQALKADKEYGSGDMNEVTRKEIMSKMTKQVQEVKQQSANEQPETNLTNQSGNRL